MQHTLTALRAINKFSDGRRILTIRSIDYRPTTKSAIVKATTRSGREYTYKADFTSAAKSLYLQLIG